MDVTLARAIERAGSSDYFTGARLADDVDRFLADHADQCRGLADELDGSIDRIYVVGSGGSYADALGVKYLFDGLLTLQVEAVASYELLWRKPRLLDSR